MEDRITLSYFYGKEADQYSFYKIPKLLFTDNHFKKVSVEAKVLYGLMLDRMSLSVKNQWLDGEGRAYIYFSLEDIMEALGCSNKKAISIMKELDADAGIGLIEKRRQGQGKPTMIYVKQFVIQDVQKCKNYTSEEKLMIPEVKKIHTNKNNINNTDFSNTKSNLIVSGNDGMGSDVEAYTELIRDNLDLDILRERYPYDQELLDGIFDLILETVLCKSESIIILILFLSEKIRNYCTYIRAYLDYLTNILHKSPEDVSWEELRDHIRWLQKSRNIIKKNCMIGK